MSVAGTNGVYLRSHLARVVYNKMIEDSYEQDHTHWYTCDTERLAPDLVDKFVLMNEDDQTTEFLRQSCEKSDWLFTQVFHSLAKFFLCWFLNNTTINGLLHCGSMFIFSPAQFERLLNIDEHWTFERLLDLGAGDGGVTAQMSRHFKEVHVTETSQTMVWRLQERNYSVLEIDAWAADGYQLYDVVSCLNLLDRCERPLTVLQDIRRVLRPTSGRLLLAIVLPFSAYVEAGDSSHQPKQHLRVTGTTFEEQVNSLVRDVLTPSGFEVVQFTRLPYLCEGDIYHSYYILYDAVFVLRSTSLL